MNPVIFLDFDGPLFPDRGIRHSPSMSEYPGKLKLDPFISYWEMDRTSVRQLNALYNLYQFDTVVSSTWKTFVNVREVVELFVVNGLNLHLHEEWCTPSSFSGRRSQEISEWLDTYTVSSICPDHIILDDPWSGSSLDGGVHSFLGFNEPLFVNPDVGIDSDIYSKMHNKITKWANDVDSHKFYRNIQLWG